MVKAGSNDHLPLRADCCSMELLFKLVAIIKRVLDIYSIDSQPYLVNSIGLLLRIGTKLLNCRITDLETLKIHSFIEKVTFPKSKQCSGANLQAYNARFITPNLVANVRFRQYCLLIVTVKDLRHGGKQPYPLSAFTVLLQWHLCLEGRAGKCL